MVETPCHASGFLPADTSAITRPLLCVILDTEEEFDWAGPFSRRHVAVEGLLHIHKGHRIFRRFGLVPAYLADYPIVADPRAVDIFGPWLEADECLVGAQLHPWVTPPFEEVVCPYNSYPCNLPAELERRKLALLTELLVDRLNVVPRIYKAGRYGLDIQREDTLAALGYHVDTSVMPYRSFAGLGGGPDFFFYPDRPFWISPERRVLHLPVSQGLVGPLRFLGQHRIGRALFGRTFSQLRLPGILARFRLLERIMLTPEGVSLEEMCRLVESELAAGNRIFALSMHSPSFMVGGTPYTHNAEELSALLGRVEEFLEFFFGRLGGQPTTPLEIRRLVEAADARLPGEEVTAAA